MSDNKPLRATVVDHCDGRCGWKAVMLGTRQIRRLNESDAKELADDINKAIDDAIAVERQRVADLETAMSRILVEAVEGSECDPETWWKKVADIAFNAHPFESRVDSLIEMQRLRRAAREK